MASGRGEADVGVGGGVSRLAQGAGEDAHEAVGVGVVVDEASLSGGPD